MRVFKLLTVEERYDVVIAVASSGRVVAAIEDGLTRRNANEYSANTFEQTFLSC